MHLQPLAPLLSSISRSFEALLPGLGTFHTFQFLSAVYYYLREHNDCFLCLLFLNYNVWPPVMDFTVCLDGKVPQQFNLLILFYAFGGMLIPFVTALNSIFLAHLPMNDPPNNIMPLFILCLRKLGATTQNMLHSFIVATTHSAFG